jgi:hypothetical protein
MKKWQMLFALGAFSSLASAANPVLESYRVTSAPVLDGVASEAFWSSAAALQFKTVEAAAPGAGNKSESTVTMKSVYTADSVYFLAVWDDPTLGV